MKARTGKLIAITLTVLVLLSVLLSYGIPIPLDIFNARLESMAGRVLDRKVTIAGPARIRLSPHPVLDFGGITIANPRDWPEDGNLLTIRRGQAKVSLLSLIGGEVQINNLAFDGVDLRLVTRADHTINYGFPNLQFGTEEDGSDFELSGMDHISLRDIQLSYHDELSDETYVMTVDQAEGRGRPESPLNLSVQGALAGQTYSLEVTGGSLHDLIHEEEPWPLADGRLKLAGMTLDLSGTLVRTRDEIGGHTQLSLAGQNLDGIEEITGLPLPEVGDFSLEARIGVLPGRFHFTGLKLTALNSLLEGDLVVFLHGERPTLAGNLAIPVVDPALVSVFDTGQTQSSVPWEMLTLLDTDLHLRIGELIPDPLRVGDLQATISLVNGDLIAPYSFTAVGSSATGRIDVLTGDGTPMVELALASESVELSTLLAGFTGQDQVTGQLGALALSAKTQGHDMQDLARGFDLDVQIGATELFTESGPILKTKVLSVEHRPGLAFALSGKGDFLGRPFSLQARAGGSKSSQDSLSIPLNLQLEACDTELQFAAALPSEQYDPLTTFRFSVKGEELCGYLDPVKDFMGETPDFIISGKGELRPAGWSLDLDTVRLGEIVVDARVEQRIDDDKDSPPIMANIHSSGLDLTPFLQGPVDPSGGMLQSVQDERVDRETEDPKEQISTEQQVAEIMDLLATEIAPLKRFLATDVILELHVEKLGTGKLSATDVRLSAVTEEGKLAHTPFQATVAGKLLTGNADLDFTAKMPAIRFELASEDINLPDLYRKLQLGDAPDLSAEHIGLELTFKGQTIKELLRQSSHKVVIKGGKWMVERELSEPLRVDIDQAGYNSTPDTPSVISLSGSVNSVPLTLELTEDGLLGQNTNKPLVLAVQAELGDTELRIDSRVIRKTDAVNILRLDTLLSGGRMDGLNEVLGVSLPPLGPYRVGGTLQLEGGTVTFHDLELQIGDSILKGEMVFETTLQENGKYDYPVTIRTKLNAESIQLNDLRTGDWSALGIQEEDPSAEGEEAQSQVEQQGSEEQLNNLLSPDLAAVLKGSLDIEVREVLSGKDSLGGGLLNARLENGLYSLDNLRLDIPGGTIRIQGSLRPEATRTEASLGMQIEHLDYGILARRVQPEADVKGELNLNLDLHSVAENPFRLKEHLNGRLRLGVVPEELLAGVIDLWAVNIITAALPTLMKGSKSEINCLAGDFILEDGTMQPEVFLLDTSKMRVKGKGEVNFKTDAIDFHLKPSPKKAQFFSLATPVSISGTITDPEIGVTAGGVLGTVARLAGSLVTVPYKKLFTDDMKPDGHEACSAAMSWVKEARRE